MVQTGQFEAEISEMRRIGVELELLAPTEATRADLARAVARAIDGRVVEGWHLDTEPSPHPTLDVFHHLTPAFDVLDYRGEQFLRLVSDVTIHSDLDLKAPPLDGWHRILSDDPRILRMMAPRLTATGATEADITAIAEVFGLSVDRRGSTTRLSDDTGASVAMITGLTGEKHRVAECISPPMTDGFERWVDIVLTEARRLGFTVPSEGATHFHFDGHLFRRPDVFHRLVLAFGLDIDLIRYKMRTNPRCRRLGPLPKELVELVEADDYHRLTWEEVAAKARSIDGITKYADVNVLHLLSESPKLDTVEFRMLPSTLDPEQLLQMRTDMVRLVEHFLD